MSETPTRPTLSQDAAIVLALAGTAVPFAVGEHDEAERWLRVLRLHGQVGCVLQALGVGEAPLETAAQPTAVRLLGRRPVGEDIVEIVADRAATLAGERRARAIGTVDILFAVLETYGHAFNRALYTRGTSREELLERLAEISPLVGGGRPDAGPAAA